MDSLNNSQVCTLIWCILQAVIPVAVLLLMCLFMIQITTCVLFQQIESCHQQHCHQHWSCLVSICASALQLVPKSIVFVSVHFLFC